MICDHTGKPFTVVTQPGPNPSFPVLKAQVEQVKSALIRSGVLFIIDHDGVFAMGKRFSIVSFRPDADIALIEAWLVNTDAGR